MERIDAQLLGTETDDGAMVLVQGVDGEDFRARVTMIPLIPLALLILTSYLIYHHVINPYFLSPISSLTAIPTILCPHVRESSKVFPAKASRISVRTSIEVV
jgi:hypothetical protein